jgi:hypothetical protein
MPIDEGMIEFFRQLTPSDFQEITRRYAKRGEAPSTESFVKELVAVTNEGFYGDVSGMAGRLAKSLILEMITDSKEPDAYEAFLEAFQEGYLRIKASGRQILIIKSSEEEKEGEVIWETTIPPLLQREIQQN